METIKQYPYKELKGFNQVVYTIGHIGPGMLSQFLTNYIMTYVAVVGAQVASETNALVLSTALAGTCTLVGEIIDAISDPLVANMSDNLKKIRFGRRLPFMVLGVIPMVISFLMVWTTFAVCKTVTGQFIWLLVAEVGFNFFYTVIVNPYFALLSEIARSTKQIAFIQSFQSLFGIVGMGIALALGGTFIKMFNGSYFYAALLFSAICIFVMIFPCFVIKPNKDYVYTNVENQTENVLKNVVGALKNDKFRNYIIGFSLFFFGFQLIQYNLANIATFQLQTEKNSYFIASVVVALAFIPLYNVFIKKWGTINALRITMGSYAIVALLIAFVPFIPLDNKIVLGYLLMGLLGFSYSGLMVIPNILCSEIIDSDCKENHVRREAMFFGVQGLINKLAGAFASFAVGWLLMLGASHENYLGVIIISPIAAVFSIIGYIIMSKMSKTVNTTVAE